MGKWTRRDLVKAGLAASVGVITRNDLLAESRESRSSAAAPAFAQSGAEPIGADQPNTLRDRLLLDHGWRFALGNADNPDKDFGFGKLRREGTFAKAGRVDGPAAPRFDANSCCRQRMRAGVSALSSTESSAMRRCSSTATILPKT